MARNGLGDDMKELIMIALFLVTVVIGGLVYSEIVYGDASCLFNECVKPKGESDK